MLKKLQHRVAWKFHTGNYYSQDYFKDLARNIGLKLTTHVYDMTYVLFF